MGPRQDAGRRELIAEAAWSCFLEFGYAKTSLEDVARRAGLSRPLIYLQFASKKELFASLMVEQVEQCFASAQAVIASDLAPRPKLLRVLEVWLVEPWSRVSGSPERNELFDEAFRLVPGIERNHRERTVELLAPLVGGPETADVFRLACKGMISDRPTADVLRVRLACLAERFVVAD